MLALMVWPASEHSPSALGSLARVKLTGVVKSMINPPAGDDGPSLPLAD